MQVALGFIALAESGELCAVSKDFCEAAEGDGLWRAAYEERFDKDRGIGSIMLQPFGANVEQSSAVALWMNDKASTQRQKRARRGFKRRYMRRIKDPQVEP